MEDLEKTKENIQPLRGGRNMEKLEIALTSESQLTEEKRAHEEQIEKYEGTDPLQPWYEYISWIEQTNLASGKPTENNDLLVRCIHKFENDERYQQDHRFIKLCMKYIDTQPGPLMLYNDLYSRGIGTLCSELYIGWAYYYDAEDNFAQTEAIYQKGFDAGAVPKEDLEQAHRQFGFTMSQRLLHKDECSKLKFQNSLAERRNALTSLKAHKKKHVGSVRTGLAVKSINPGVINQENLPSNSINVDAVAVYSAVPMEKDSTMANPSIVRSLVDANRDRENIREPGPWSNAKSNQKRGPLFGVSHNPSFAISEDSVEYQPIPSIVENYSRGIQLESHHKGQNYPQKSFEISACDDDKPSGFPVYDKLSLYCSGPKHDYSPEELHGYRYFKRRGISNEMTSRYESIWGNGAHVGIRLHPYHVREYKCNTKDDLRTDHPQFDSSVEGIRTRMKEMYAAVEELSMEELRLQKWKDGKIKRYVDKHDDDMLRVDMDETVVQTKRVSIAPPRASIAPMQAVCPSRKSVFPLKANMSMISEEEKHEEMTVVASEEVTPQEECNQLEEPPKYTGAIKKSDIYKRRSNDSPGLKSGPKKKISLEAPEVEEKEDEIKSNFAVPAVKPRSKLTIPIFLDDDEPVENKESNGYYPNETCSTQMFNMFVKSQSTPLALKSGEARQPEHELRRQHLILDDQQEIDQGQQDENLAEMQEIKINDENAEPESMPSNSNITQAPKQLSTIMERTETSTISAACSTKSSVSSSPQLEIVSPTLLSEQERSVNHSNINMKQAVKNLSAIPLEVPSRGKTIEESMFKVPDAVDKPKPTENPFEVFDDVPIAPKPVSISPFIIHIDSTETMASIPLVSKNDLPPKITSSESIEDKENKRFQMETANQNSLFQMQEEVTATASTNILRKNISHLPQRELGIDSIMSFKMTTERTNTVPLPLLKQPETIKPTTTAKPSKADDSLFELLAKTPSPKGMKLKSSQSPTFGTEKKPDKHKNSSFFDLADFQKTPEKKKVDAPPIQQERSVTIESAVSNAPKPFIIQSVRGAINLAEFPSPQDRRSMDDMNTEIFSLNMNNMKNSTLLPGRFTEFEVPDKATIEISPGERKPSPQGLDFDISIGEVEFKRMALEDKKHFDGFKMPAPILKSPPIIELDDGDSDDLGKSIYVQRQPKPVETDQKWDEIDEHFNPANNEYMKKEVDFDGTMHFIYQQTHVVGEVDPFDPKLQEAFLEKMDFMSYIEELPTCCMVNKVQPLARGMVESVRDTKISVIKKIGEGTFGTVYCGKNLISGEVVAMKQERPANLWEYYICLELRSRINSDDILPGLMSVDYAIVGNNASILVSPFSRFGNILDVCNVVKRVTNKNVDEFIAMIITSQILSIIDHLHSCMIIHADIKPDNFLLMSTINLDSRIPCVQLIDFGVSIDLKLFPKGTTFKKVVTTECFTCIEMLEKRPWNYQPDLYGVAGTTHVMLFGKYMEVQKDIVSWNIKARMPRYFRKNVWDNFFDTLLNIRDCNEMPNLQALRSVLLAEIEENYRYIRDKISEFNQAVLSA